VLARVRARRPCRPRRGDHGRVAAPRPWHGVLIALALLLLQGPSVFHLLFVPHATCVHGELVDASPHPQRSAHVGAPPDQDHPRIDRGDEDGAGHEHCDALAVRHRVPDVDVFVAPATLLPVTLIDAGGERLEARPVPLLSLAPKGSPPVC
jgi:hypothetical protein